MVRSPDPPPSHERYNRTNTMFASAGSLLGWRTARPAPRPSRRTLLIAVVVAGLGLSVPGANAVARNDPSILSAPGAAEDAAVQAEATQLRASLIKSGPTRLITISLQAQRLIAYDRGRVVVDTLVTTGRPSLATDVGAMRITRKDSPWTMQSPWPKGSPEWYPDTPVRMALWFTENGEGLHDASWQPDVTLGPGSQNGPFASHGCVHLPLAAVTTLFQWAPIGTPVVVVPGDGAPAVTQVAQRTVDAEGNPLTGVRGD